MNLRLSARLLAVVCVFVAIAACGGESPDSDGGADGIEYLFVQNAAGASLADGKLTLKGIAPSTIYFSDRPERITGHVDTAAFVANWGVGKDSFESDPPNAALSILGESAPEDVVVELRNPRLEAGNLVYDVDVLEGESTAEGDSCALFIDVIGRPMTPVSAAGMDRRVRRRTYRRR